MAILQADLASRARRFLCGRRYKSAFGPLPKVRLWRVAAIRDLSAFTALFIWAVSSKSEAADMQVAIPSLVFIGMVVTAGAVSGAFKPEPTLEPQIAHGGAPLTLRVAYTDGGGNFNGPVDGVRVIDSDAPKRPVLVVLPGCAFGVKQLEATLDAIIVSVDENPDVLQRSTMLEACKAADAEAITVAIEAQARFMFDSLAKLEMVDPGRVVLAASGDAAPIAAGMAAPVRGKVLIGDPCYVRWPPEALTTAEPTTLFWSDEPEGRTRAAPGADTERGGGQAGSLSPTATSGAADWAASVSGRPCEPVPRPTRLGHSVDVRIVSGSIQTFSRPEGMLEAQQKVFHAYASR